MAQLANCPECGRLYVENPMKLCPDCRKKELEDEDTVAHYLRDTKKASIKQIAEATGVKEKIILRMLNRGRIIGDVEITYACEICGADIVEGRVCAACSKSITDQMRAKAEEKKTEPVVRQESRMYTNVHKIRGK